MKRPGWIRWFPLFLLALLVSVSEANAAEASKDSAENEKVSIPEQLSTRAVRGDFRNPLFVAEPVVTVAEGPATYFSGVVGAPALRANIGETLPSLRLK